MKRREFCGVLAAALGVALVDPRSLVVPEVKPYLFTLQHGFLVQEISFLNTGEIGSKSAKLSIMTEEMKEAIGLILPLSENTNFTPYRPIWIPGNTDISLLGDPGSRIALHGIEIIPRGGSNQRMPQRVDAEGWAQYSPSGQVLDQVYKTYWWTI